MATIARNRIRLALDTMRPLEPTYDFVSNLRPRFPRARALAVEVALYSDDTLLELGGITSMIFEVKPLTSQTGGVIDATQVNVMSDTVESGLFNLNLTDSEWENDSGTTPYHCQFTFSVAETTLTMTGAVANELKLGYVVTAITGSGRITCGTGTISCFEEGGSGAGVPVAPNPTYTYTDEELDAMIAGKLGFSENPAGAAFILVSKDGTKKGIIYWGDDGAFHAESIS